MKKLWQKLFKRTPKEAPVYDSAYTYFQLVDDQGNVLLETKIKKNPTPEECWKNFKLASVPGQTDLETYLNAFKSMGYLKS